MSSFLIPISLARLSSAMSALYFASLFVSLKPHRIACWIRSPSGEVRTRLMLALLMLLEPSNDSVYLELECFVKLSCSLSACGVTFGAKSVMKSTKT